VSDSTADETDDERRKRGRAPDPLLPGQKPPVITVPTPVTISFWLWIATGVVLVAGQIALLVLKQELTDGIIKQITANPVPGQPVDPAQIASGVNTLLWMLLGGAVTFAVLFALFAYKAREGTRSARTVLTVGAVFLVLVELFVLRGTLNVFLLVATLLTAIALILMYLPSVADFFPKVGRKLP
jgi:peptidoglycan/LPS O-acetylase OafA/YrhL